MNEVSTPVFTTGRIGLYAGSNSLWFDDVNVLAKQMDDFVAVSAIEYKELGFKIYPNPVVGNVFYVRCKTSDFRGELKIYDVSGQVVLTKKINKNTVAVSTNNFKKSGMYIIEITSENTTVTDKIIINKQI